jgi:FMN-dependent NADH-azoreductase
MTHLLHIDASPRQDRSISRTLTQEFITDWKTAHPSDTVTDRDLGHHVTGIDRAVEAFLGLFEGKNLGKMVMKLDWM